VKNISKEASSKTKKPNRNNIKMYRREIMCEIDGDYRH